MDNEASRSLDKLFEQLKPQIDAMITERIIMFHDALVKRGQISDAPPGELPEVIVGGQVH